MSSNYSGYALTPVRFYTEYDPYNFTIDNRPIQDLNTNSEALYSAVKSAQEFSSKKVINAADAIITGNNAEMGVRVMTAKYPYISLPDGAQVGMSAYFSSDSGFNLDRPIVVNIVYEATATGDYKLATRVRPINANGNQALYETGIWNTLTVGTTNTVMVYQLPTLISVTEKLLSGVLTELGVIRSGETDTSNGELKIHQIFLSQ